MSKHKTPPKTGEKTNESRFHYAIKKLLTLASADNERDPSSSV